jgi:anti-anti-sigma factor
MTGRRLQLHEPIVRIVVEVQPPALCLSVEGELDLSSHQLLEAVPQMDLTGVDTLLINLAGMSFCDVAGFRSLSRLHDSQRAEDRHVHLLDPQRCFLRLAQLTNTADLHAAG